MLLVDEKRNPMIMPGTMPDPDGYEDEAPWSLDAIRARIDARMLELDKTPSQMQKVFNRRWGKNGPSLRVLGKIAKKLNWTLPELLGIRVADPKLLTYAVQIISEALSMEDVPGCPLTDHGKTGPLIAEAYEWLDAFTARRPEITYDQVAHIISGQIKRRLDRARPSSE